MRVSHERRNPQIRSRARMRCSLLQRHAAGLLWRVADLSAERLHCCRLFVDRRLPVEREAVMRIGNTSGREVAIDPHLKIEGTA
jgi:hypothetical protein